MSESGKGYESRYFQSEPKDSNPLELIYAIESGDRTTIRSLLFRGADVNAANEDGVTPLMVVAEKGDDITVRALILNGANPNLENSNGETAAALAAKNGHSTIVRSLKFHGDIADRYKE